MIDIIVLTYNNLQNTSLCIESIFAYTSGFRLIVVDNNSTDGTVEYLKKLDQENLILHFSSKNLGCVIGRNFAYTLSKDAEYICFLDNDQFVTEGWVESYMSYIDRGFDVIGFDRSSGLVNLARENVGCEVIEGDFETYDFSAISADAIMLIGTLVHIPYDRFSDFFKDIIFSLSDFGKILITLKEGTGTWTDEKGRTFYLWQDEKARIIFDSHGFTVCDFSRSVSKTGSGEIWLGYVLEKMKKNRCKAVDEAFYDAINV